MQPTPSPTTFSPRNLLLFWLGWMLGNVATVFLNIYLHTYLIFIFWSLAVFVAQGYFFSQLRQAKYALRVQLLGQLLLVAGAIFTAIEGLFLYWFLEGCLFAEGCFWLNL